MNLHSLLLGLRSLSLHTPASMSPVSTFSVVCSYIELIPLPVSRIIIAMDSTTFPQNKDNTISRSWIGREACNLYLCIGTYGHGYNEGRLNSRDSYRKGLRTKSDQDVILTTVTNPSMNNKSLHARAGSLFVLALVPRI